MKIHNQIHKAVSKGDGRAPKYCL